MADISFDTDTAMFGWAAPFDIYNPELPVSVRVSGACPGPDLIITAGCRLSTLLAALQLRGMEKPGG